MLESLQQFGKDVGRELAKAWENLSEGWRELLSRSGNALTRFVRTSHDGEGPGGTTAPAALHWGVLSGDVIDTGSSIVVRVELPGIGKDDCEIVVDGNTLYVKGEKRIDTEYAGGSYYLRQCAFGAFQRAIALPHSVEADGAEAEFRNGVLTVRLPKVPVQARRVYVR